MTAAEPLVQQCCGRRGAAGKIGSRVKPPLSVRLEGGAARNFFARGQAAFCVLQQARYEPFGKTRDDTPEHQLSSIA